MDAFQLPEMLRTPLEELCLQVKALKLGRIQTFLGKAMQPPAEAAIGNAIHLLRHIGALDANEELTPLGRHLSNLPVDPRLGKMMLFGTIFQCLDPILTIASCLAYRDPFVLPFESERPRALAIRAKYGFRHTSLCQY
jgi:ATP-dependent RNA helicase DHX36